MTQPTERPPTLGEEEPYLLLSLLARQHLNAERAAEIQCVIADATATPLFRALADPDEIHLDELAFKLMQIKSEEAVQRTRRSIARMMRTEVTSEAFTQLMQHQIGPRIRSINLLIRLCFREPDAVRRRNLIARYAKAKGVHREILVTDIHQSLLYRHADQLLKDKYAIA